MPTAMQKLRVFAPQIGLTTAAIASFEVLTVTQRAAFTVPATVLGILTGLIAFVTGLWKSLEVSQGDWAQYLPGSQSCKHCKKLEAAYADLKRDRDELRDALVTLQLPESRS